MSIFFKPKNIFNNNEVDKNFKSKRQNLRSIQLNKFKMLRIFVALISMSYKDI